MTPTYNHWKPRILFLKTLKLIDRAQMIIEAITKDCRYCRKEIRVLQAKIIKNQLFRRNNFNLLRKLKLILKEVLNNFYLVLKVLFPLINKKIICLLSINKPIKSVLKITYNKIKLNDQANPQKNNFKRN